MNMMDAKELDLLTICKGSVPEIFLHELQKVLNNIGDLNTAATKPRSISLTFTFIPFPDRSGATVAVSASCKLGALDASGASGSIYLAKRDGKFAAFSRDLRQELLFDGQDAPRDGKTAAAGGDGISR